MGWVTLTLRKKDLKNTISEYELRDIELSRETRSVQRQLAYDQSIFNTDKTQELRKAKANYTAVKGDKVELPEDTSNEEAMKAYNTAYEDWKTKYEMAKEDYEAKKVEIEDFYDDQMNEIEQEATDRENDIEQERTTIEAQLQAVRSELESVNDQIKSDIDSSKLTLS